MTTSEVGFGNRACFCAALVCVALVSWPGRAETIKDAIAGGEPEVDLRYRFEWVDQDNFGPTANASTLRVRLGWTTGKWRNLSAHVGFDGNFSIGSERYNSTANGSTQYPTVADPDDQQLNQAWIAYDGPAGLRSTLGRQRVNIDNQRFIGSVGFRQLEQTLDAFRFDIAPVDKLAVSYLYVNRVHRVFGDHNPTPTQAEADHDSHLVHLAYDLSNVKVVGYVYALDFEDAPASSHRSAGVRLTGEPKVTGKLTAPFTLEYADQADYAGAPSTVDAEYYVAELALTSKTFGGRVGYEVLGGDGVYGFQTPLATLHAFNGWADKFLTTPATGLRDLYAQLFGKIGELKLLAIYHDFSADDGGADYGTEWGVRVWREFNKIYQVEAKYADYSSDGFAEDTAKLWLTLGLKL